MSFLGDSIVGLIGCFDCEGSILVLAELVEVCGLDVLGQNVMIANGPRWMRCILLRLVWLLVNGVF